MKTERRATVILLQSGDAEISGAIAGGMLTARAARRNTAEPAGAAGQGRHTEELLVRVAVHRGRGPEYWETMIAEAQYKYGQPERPPGPLRRLGRALMGVYGLLVYGVSEAYRQQERVLGRCER